MSQTNQKRTSKNITSILEPGNTSRNRGQTSDEHDIPVTNCANQPTRRGPKKMTLVRKLSEITSFVSIIFQFKIIFGYSQEDDSISFAVERETPKKASSKNFKKGVGFRFVKYLREIAKICLSKNSGDALHSLDVWNSLFNQQLREGKFPKRSKPFIDKLCSLGNTISEKKWIYHFLNFISLIDPKEFYGSNKMATDSIQVYVELATLIAISGRILHQIFEDDLNEISYLMIKQWNGNRVEFNIKVGSGDQNALSEKLKQCVNLDTVYSYNSDKPNSMSFKLKTFSQVGKKEKEELPSIIQDSHISNERTFGSLKSIFTRPSGPSLTEELQNIWLPPDFYEFQPVKYLRLPLTSSLDKIFAFDLDDLFDKISLDK